MTASLLIAKEFIERDLAGEKYDIFDDEFLHMMACK
jgi:hypothetical protein